MNYFRRQCRIFTTILNNGVALVTTHEWILEVDSHDLFPLAERVVSVRHRAFNIDLERFRHSDEVAGLRGVDFL